MILPVSAPRRSRDLRQTSEDEKRQPDCQTAATSRRKAEGSIPREHEVCLTRLCVALGALTIYQARNCGFARMGDPVHDRAKRGILLTLQAPCRPELDGVAEPRVLACKLCGGKSRVVLGCRTTRRRAIRSPTNRTTAGIINATIAIFFLRRRLTLSITPPYTTKLIGTNKILIGMVEYLRHLDLSPWRTSC